MAKVYRHWQDDPILAPTPDPQPEVEVEVVEEPKAKRKLAKKPAKKA